MVEVRFSFKDVISSIHVDLGGLVVSVLATGPKVRGFDPDRGRWIFKGDKNPEHFLSEEKEKNLARKQTSVSKSPDCLPDGSGSHIRIELNSAASELVTYCHKCTRPSNLGKRMPKPI
jgi:hypothetical protein